MSTVSSVRPLARFDALVVSDIDRELVVFDQRTHAIHQLDAISAQTWQCCDGQQTVAEIARKVSLNLAEPVSTATIELALGKLAEVDLLATPWVGSGHGESRRSLLRKAAVSGAAVVPAIISVSAPQAVAARSDWFPCLQCYQDGPCCPGVCNGLQCCSNGDVCNGTCCSGGDVCIDGGCCQTAHVCGTTCCSRGRCEGDVCH